MSSLVANSELAQSSFLMSQAQLALKTGQAKFWILLVGVSQYYDRRFPTLQYSTIDTQRLADAFADVTQEFQDISVKVHHDSALPPTVSAVRSSLQEIVENAQPQDTVLFYFSGHGALDARMQQVVFCLADTQKDTMLQTGLSALSLLGSLGNCAAKQQILWVEACHANGMMPQTDATELLDNPTCHLIEMFQRQASQVPGFQSLLSCDRAQQSWKFPELGHGVFTHFLIEGLRGGAANPQGIVTASVLENYVRDRTVQYIDRTNQQLEWLHRDGKKHSSKAIVQKPVRIGNAQVQVPLGIRPKDPLEYLFPEIKAPNIEPPLARCAPLHQPKLNPVVPPPIEKPATIEPAIPPIQKIVPESIPSPELTLEIKSLDPVPPIVQEPIAEFIEPSELKKISPEPVEPVQKPQTEKIQVESAPSIQPVSVEETLPEEIELIPLVQEPVAIEETVLPEVAKPVQPESSEIQAISPELSAATPEAIAPVEPPRKRNETQRQIKRFHRITKKRLNSAATTLNGAVREATQSAGNFATFQHAQARQQAVHLHSAISTKLNALSQSTRQAATVGQMLYRQRAAEVSHIATDAVQNLDRSTRSLTQSAFEQTQKPETRQFLTAVLKSLGMITIGIAGVGLYVHRNDQIHEIQTLTSAATTETQSNQTKQALSNALKAGHTLQQVDRPWNFVPESLKLSTIATLQQAIALTGSTPTPIGVALSNATLSPDQNTFAASTPKNTIQIWRSDAVPQPKTELGGHKAPIIRLVFSPDGKRLASASEDKTIKIWDVEKGILIQTLSAHTQAVTALSFRSDGEVLASGSIDQTIKLWSVSKGRILDTFKGHNATASVIRFSPDGRILAAGALTNTIHLWYPDSQNPVLLGSHSRMATTQGISDLAFSPDGKTIASAGADRTVKLWNIGAATVDRETLPTQTLTGHENEVTSLSFSASGQILASGGHDRTIRLWNMQDGTFIKTLFGSPDPIEQIAFSADGKSLSSIGNLYGSKRWSLDLDSLMKAGCQLAGTRSQAGCS